MFPSEEIKIVVSYLRGNPNNYSIKAVAKAVVAIQAWLVEFIPETPLFTSTMPVEYRSAADALESLLNSNAAIDWTPPSWVWPILFEILRKLIG